MTPTRRTSRIRPDWPPAETQPPWDRLFSGDLDSPREPAIAHLGASQIARQLVEVIQDEAGSLETQARRQVAQKIQRAIRPWLG